MNKGGWTMPVSNRRIAPKSIANKSVAPQVLVMIMTLLALMVMVMPVVLGVLGAVLPAFGYLPPLGGEEFGIKPFVDFFNLPGMQRSIVISLTTGLIATVLSTVLALLLPGLLYGSRFFSAMRHYLAPMLSLPHVTVAVGLLFLLQPSGWLIRLISPVLTGWDRPPIWGIVQDPYGIGLVIGLIAKEVPFLVLLVLAALSQINTKPLLIVGRSLGYGPMTSWIYLIIPALWVRLRLPVVIVLVFSLSVVDMALVLTPSTASPLAVRLLWLYQDADLAMRFTASAAAVVQMVIVLAAAVMGWFLVKGLGIMGRSLAFTGHRFARSPLAVVKPVVACLAILPTVLAAMGLVAAGLWSVAGRWRFPSAWPDTLTFRHWSAVFKGLDDVVLTTLALGAVSSAIAVIMVMLWLSQGQSPASPRPLLKWPLLKVMENSIYLPLLLPQAGFLFGVQVMLLWFGLDGTWLALIWAHLLFVLPYVWLSLAPSWRSFNPQWTMLAASLGARPWRRFLTVKLPIMALPVLTSFAVGFSVSAALYLPTVFASNGRITTLTVEAVTLAEGSSRSPLGVATGLQMMLPLVIFILATTVARLRYKKFSYFS